MVAETRDFELTVDGDGNAEFEATLKGTIIHAAYNYESGSTSNTVVTTSMVTPSGQEYDLFANTGNTKEVNSPTGLVQDNTGSDGTARQPFTSGHKVKIKVASGTSGKKVYVSYVMRA